jgi:hypothetical protein
LSRRNRRTISADRGVAEGAWRKPSAEDRRSRRVCISFERVAERVITIWTRFNMLFTIGEGK